MHTVSIPYSAEGSEMTGLQWIKLRKNYREAKLESTTDTSTYRMSKEKEETVIHIVSECPTVVQAAYKKHFNSEGLL